MSLINDALKDIEETHRAKPREKMPFTEKFQGLPKAAKKPGYLALLIIGGMLILADAAIFVWHYTPNQQKRLEKSANQSFVSKHVVTPNKKIQTALMKQMLPKHALAPKAVSKKPVDKPQMSVTAAVKPENVTDLYHQALSLVKVGNLNVAILKLKAVVSASPRFNQARQFLAILLMQTKQYAMADKILDQGLNISPDYIPFVTLKAHSFVNQHQYQMATVFLGQYSPKLAMHPNFYALKASVDELMKNDEEAIFIYKRLIHAFPEKSNWWVGLGAAYQSKGILNKAKTAYTRALSLGGLSPEMQVYIREQMGSLQND